MEALTGETGESGFEGAGESPGLCEEPLGGPPGVVVGGNEDLLAGQFERVAMGQLVVPDRIGGEGGAVLPEFRADRLEEGVGGCVVHAALALGLRAGDVPSGQLEGVAAEGEGGLSAAAAVAGLSVLGLVGEACAGDLERVAGLEDFVGEVGGVVVSADDGGTGAQRPAGGCDGGGGL